MNNESCRVFQVELARPAARGRRDYESEGREKPAEHFSRAVLREQGSGDFPKQIIGSGFR